MIRRLHQGIHWEQERDELKISFSEGNLRGSKPYHTGVSIEEEERNENMEKIFHDPDCSWIILEYFIAQEMSWTE